MRRSIRGFTLVELLVTLMIVTILAALIFGATKRVQSSARSVKCISNLRQIGVGALNYFSDNGGKLLPSRDWYYPSTDSDASLSYDGLLGYAGITLPSGVKPKNLKGSILTCPELKTMFPDVNISYSVNRFAIRYNPYPSVPGTLEPVFPSTLFNIKSRSKMMMFTDGVYIGDGFMASCLNSDFYSLLHLPHSKKQNVVFFDGHVEAVDKSLFSPPDTSDFWGNIPP